MPDFSFLGEHEENKKWNKGSLKHQGIERTDAADQQISDRPGILMGNNQFGWLAGTGQVIYPTFDSIDISLYLAGGLVQDVPIFGPIGGEIRSAEPQGVSRSRENQYQEQDENEGANGAGNAEALQEFHGGIQKISDEDGKKQGDDDTRGVIKKQQDDRRSDQPHAEV